MRKQILNTYSLSLSTFPHYKHLPNTVIAAEQPNIRQVFLEASTFVELED